MEDGDVSGGVNRMSKEEMLEDYWAKLSRIELVVAGCGGGQVTSGHHVDTARLSNSGMPMLTLPSTQTIIEGRNRDLHLVAERESCVAVFVNEVTLRVPGQEEKTRH